MSGLYGISSNTKLSFPKSQGKWHDSIKLRFFFNDQLRYEHQPIFLLIHFSIVLKLLLLTRKEENYASLALYTTLETYNFQVTQSKV